MLLLYPLCLYRSEGGSLMQLGWLHTSDWTVSREKALLWSNNISMSLLCKISSNCITVALQAPFHLFYHVNYFTIAQHTTVGGAGILIMGCVGPQMSSIVQNSRRVFHFLYFTFNPFFSPISWYPIVSSYCLVSSLQLPYGLGRGEGREPCTAS